MSSGPDPFGGLVGIKTGPISKERKVPKGLNNFRFSLLNVFFKLLNSTGKARLNQCLKDYHIPNNNSIRHSSAASCPNQILPHISIERSRKEQAFGLSIDMSKAYEWADLFLLMNVIHIRHESTL